MNENASIDLPPQPVISQPLIGIREPSFLADDLLPAIFVASAERHPQRPAAEFQGRRVSYAELDRLSDRIAAGLLAQGIGRGSFVGLWMSRSLDLHVALLGILKTGAAYLPFDADAPAARVGECLADCEAAGVIVDHETSAKADGLSGTLAFSRLFEAGEAAAPVRAFQAASPSEPAYVIYTSGSTGKPKGVVISHRNICHFLKAANSLYRLTAEDVVFQGGSVAFDLSLEEIFVPYLAGAKLWIASRQTLQATDHLAEVMVAAGLTVLDTVPTLLSMLPPDMPGLRIVILGGEACPPALAEKWSRPGRRLFNGYGPTETTVVSTLAELEPGRPVTIGRPIPNYSAYVVDEAMALLPPGREGELLIGGPGVAQGYLGRPELTAQKFIANPFGNPADDPVLYRTGDSVSIDSDGALLFHGRIDDQVKIRGYRIELGEIEALLAACPGVAHAAVVLRQDGGYERLAAFVVADGDLDLDLVKARLKERLPSYMLPAHFETIAALPRLISGKLDRKTLKSLPLTAVSDQGQEEPASAVEKTLLDALKRVFPGQIIPFDADIFVDLGGHSLIAARFVSAVRETPALAGLTLQDVYELRTLRKMAACIEERLVGGEPPARSLAFTPPSWMRRFLCGLAQAATMPVLLSLVMAPWLGVFVAYQLFSGEEHNFLHELGAILVTYTIINAATVLVAIAVKWLVIGRTRPGRYPLWGVYYFRLWLVDRFLALVHTTWMQGTPIMNAYLRLLGTKVGTDASLSHFEAGAIDLLSIGSGAVIGGNTQIANAEVIGNELIIGEVEIGRDAVVGTSCVIGRNVIVGEGAELADLTMVADGGQVGDWERWEGSPGRRTGMSDKASLPAASEAGILHRGLQWAVYALTLLVLPPVSLIPVIPAFYLLDDLTDLADKIGVDYHYLLPAFAWPVALLLVIVTILLIAVLRWTILPKVRAGTYSIHSWFYLRKWIVALASELTLDTLSSLYATVYMCSWYRLMGAKIGKDAEISTNLAGRYDLTEIGEKSFVADEVMLGEEEVRRGWMYLKPVRVAARVFVGNSAVVQAGAVIPEGSLIGIKSRPPQDCGHMAPGDVWFGSPPMKFPVRQRFDDVSSNWTFEPTRRRRLGRAIFEAFRVSLPTMLFITFGTIAVDLLAPAMLDRDYSRIIPQFMASSVLISLAMALVAAAIKWLMMGTYQPTVKPMWSWWALRTEAVATVYWGMAGKVLLEHLRGTPFLPMILRLFGSRFGRGVFLDTTDITEFDCIDVGDFCAINSGSALQTHLYEDRVMKVGTVRLGTGVTVGGGSTVLYDTRIGDFARIGPLTIIMKGEEIPANSEWRGAPATTVPAMLPAQGPVAETMPADALAAGRA